MSRSKVGSVESSNKAQPGAKRNTTERSGPLGELVTMRMVILFGLMRRGGVLGQRRQFNLSETEWRIMAQVGEFAP
jgi:hypothetical protein